MKNSSTFLEPLLSAGIITEKVPFQTPFYAIRPHIWLHIMQSMDLKTYYKMEGLANSSIYYGKKQNIALSKVINAHFNHQPFEHLLEPLHEVPGRHYEHAYCEDLVLGFRNEVALMPVLEKISRNLA